VDSTRKIKVLHIIKSLGRGGAEMLLQETLRYHDKRRYDFHYVYFLPWKDQMVDGIRAAGGVVVNFPAGNNIDIIRKTSSLKKYIDDNGIDIIHSHLPWAGFVARRIFSRVSLPVIYTEHNKQERYHFITRFLNRHTFNNQTAVIAVSDDVALSIRENIKASIPVHTVLNGIDAERCRRDNQSGLLLRKKYDIPEDSVILGNIAVFRPQKRLKEWVDLFSILLEANPDIYGMLVGAGMLFEEIKDYVEVKGLKDRIILPGLKSDVLPWLSAIDIYVMTSEFEGLPIALLEAMSMECAVVCTDAGGIKQVIRNEIDGFTVPVNSWRECRGPIEDLIINKSKIRRYGSAARERVERSFNLRNMVEEIETIYTSLTKND
jgi:glycosyltransferase involved in cell wall biosynthesis